MLREPLLDPATLRGRQRASFRHGILQQGLQLAGTPRDVRDIAVVGDHLLEEPFRLGLEGPGIALAKLEMVGVLLVGHLEFANVALAERALFGRPSTLRADATNLAFLARYWARASRASPFASRPLAAA